MFRIVNTGILLIFYIFQFYLLFIKILIIGWYKRTVSGNKLRYIIFPSLAGVDQWIEHQPGNQRVTGLIPSQGTYLGCGPCPQ